MHYGELLNSLLINLQSFIKKNINIDDVSFQRVIALSIIPTDGIEMSALANRLGIDNSTATRLIIGMEKIGWVDRQSSRLDKRVVQVYLTSKGCESQIDLEKQLDLIGKEVELNLNPLEKQKMIDHISHLSWVLLKLSINK